MYSISKTFAFEASHQLVGLPDVIVQGKKEAHPCTRIHGHSYRVEVIAQTEKLNEHGFVFDYAEFAPLEYYIKEHMDHRHLNDILEQPSAENIAKHIYGMVAYMYPNCYMKVNVSETQKTWASYGEKVVW